MSQWNLDLLCKNYGSMGKNYGIIENTMLVWTKPRYCTWNYGTSIYEEKNMVDYQKTMKLWFIMEKLW